MSRTPPELKVKIPQSRIAQYPLENRAESKILVYNNSERRIAHIGRFTDIVEFVAGDLLIVNDTQVMPALVRGWKSGGGKANILFFANEIGFDDRRTKIQVDALINPGRRLQPGAALTLPENASYRLLNKDGAGRWTGIWKTEGANGGFHEWLNRAGLSPLPPYIRRDPESDDRERYQTVYARSPGSLAAPTAGFHFSKALIDKLKANGCEFAEVTLDVGLGTFMPIRSDDLAGHEMHRETYEIPRDTVEKIEKVKAKGRNITVVGTTVVRTLEDAANKNPPLMPGRDSAELFIYPPYEFKFVNRLLTNFHRPDSTLIQLLAALIGWEGVNITYAAALKEDFRFFSYGDAMLII